MPRIFDNIELPLLAALKGTLHISNRADFCVGYFNLRGWKSIDTFVEPWAGGENACCRLMIGMQAVPQDELRTVFSLTGQQDLLDNQAVLRFKKRVAEEFREQLMIGAPTNADEAGLRRLSVQIKAKKVVIKLFLGHKLHAKLYLLYRTDPVSPIVGYLGSSNLTFAGLSHQGELNVDVVEYDACCKLEKWFNDRWNDHWCLDISDELATIIDTSWAREEVLPPYYIYLKMAYHLSEEARSGLSEFRIPRDFGNRLFEYQSAAVKIAAHHVNKRDGVLIGDVVGLGKTLMATALARILQDDQALETLIICPKNLVKMWQDYVRQYRLIGEVLSVSRVIRELPNLRRFRLVIIDESHNLRNRESLSYRAIKDYIEKNESKCILLSATPYNKTYLDLSNQLRLFVPEDRDLGIRPEKQIAAMGEAQFLSRFQCPVRSLAAFEKSDYADDWRDLMRLYLVRRTRSFIQDNYAETDPISGRKYLAFADGGRSYFPTRIPRTVKFRVNEQEMNDPYALLYSDAVVETINSLNLPRYGLGNYIASSPKQKPTQAEKQQLDSLSRAGKRLMGFCRTNLFKRLESSGSAFIQSLERHILRNYIYLHAIEEGLDIPIGTQDVEMLDTRISDEDNEAAFAEFSEEDEDATVPTIENTSYANTSYRSEADYQRRAAAVYAEYRAQYSNRFKWLRPTLFVAGLKKALLEDARNLLDILTRSGRWNPANDKKLAALVELLTNTYPSEKILVFTQFADTVYYLAGQLKARGIQAIEGVTGGSQDPTALAWRFSPVSNEKRNLIAQANELRILVATDVLSEGQNLQDAYIVVNYDLPWAIIRLIQRAGRVDRIGQKSDTILCYSFLPAEGVERVIRLRARVRQRLKENAEVVGTDEAFFEDDVDDQTILNLYNEKAGILDGDADTEVDLASYAYQIWKNATDANPGLKSIIENLPNVVFSTRAHVGTVTAPEGVLVYMRTAEGNDSLAWIDRNGKSVTQSQLTILRVAECSLDTPAIERPANQHELVQQGVEHIAEEEMMVGGQLGRPSGARYRTYQRLKQYADTLKGTLFESTELLKAIDDIYRYPLQQVAIDRLNRQLKSGSGDEALKDLVIALRADDRLCLIQEEEQEREPHIICSLGLCDPGRGKKLMPIMREVAQRYLKDFNFKSLFTQQLGWNNYNARPLYVSVDNQSYMLRGVVEKRGMVVYVCEPGADGSIPLSPLRRKIEKEVTKTTYEHIIIYVDARQEHQVWQWMRREPGKPTASRENAFSKNQTGEALLQKLPGIAFALSQEENLALSHVIGNVRRTFDVERVTKRFYDRFQAEHTTFLRFIKGIPVEGDREWYASLMLNRLMFVYFIQKKGFLDNDEHYLRNRLKTIQERKGNFLNFYRHFLLRLFHEGLGKHGHSAELEALLGKVPYLNGGLFDVHELERANQQIQVADEAFEKLFDFFDAYKWHLNEHPLRADNEINPDVLGYIFEKYINQKQMGAYYTKEDITEYIGKNTIIPFLFDAAENKCVIAFEPGSSTWRLLQENPDTYIYEAVKKGMELPLPPEIAIGLDNVSQRIEWNKPAPEEYALPTEIWREVVTRRKRYEEVRAKLASGEVHFINDLITYNLDIRQFAHDVIESSEGPELVRAFYNSITSVTVLDPTCGSGAFLFAALNILEPLYEACLEGMQSMVSDRDRLDETTPQSRRSSQQSLTDFRTILKQVEQHPNRRYFILKSIIINNLYGVDIMEEATEICKLRLFLKLAAQVERDTTKPNFGLEPLPDIDFNIRSGNTLVGFATYEEAKKVISSKLDFDNALERIEEKAKGVERDFEIFRKIQTEFDIDPTSMTDMKRHLRDDLKELNAELNSYLAKEYGKDQNNIPIKEDYAKKYEQWQLSHKPFHWFIEFHSIMKSGGFDVVIGNPPYVAYSKVRSTYQVHNYLTEPCGNLYAFTMERSLHLIRRRSYFGMIVPVSSISSESYKPLISLFLPHQFWLSSYSNRPGKLFAGVEQRLTIFLAKNSTVSDLFSAPYQHWYETERDQLFDCLFYTRASIWTYTGMPIKSGALEAEAVFAHLTKQGGTLPMQKRVGGFATWFHDGPTYWVRALPFEPNIGMRSDRSNHYHRMPTTSYNDALVLATLLSSSTFYFFFKMVSNCRDLGQKEWATFPFGKPTQNTLEALIKLGEAPEKRLQTTAVKCTRQYPSGTIEYEEYYPAKAKFVIDEIDRALAKHYSFSEEELDFIINYNIKYRMGRGNDEEDE